MTDKTEAQRLADALDAYGETTQAESNLRAKVSALLRRWPDAGEPVAWTTMPDSDDWMFISGRADPNGRLPEKWLPLYTTPPAESERIAALEAALEQARGAIEALRSVDVHSALTEEDADAINAKLDAALIKIEEVRKC